MQPGETMGEIRGLRHVEVRVARGFWHRVVGTEIWGIGYGTGAEAEAEARYRLRVRRLTG